MSGGTHHELVRGEQSHQLAEEGSEGQSTQASLAGFTGHVLSSPAIAQPSAVERFA